MTVSEMGVVLRGMAPAVKEYFAEAIAQRDERVDALQARLKALEDGSRVREGVIDVLTAQIDALRAKGVDGLQGPPGEKGLDGLHGKDGEPGAKGEVGERGLDGKDGLDGAVGLPGASGERGEPGPVGEKGELGPVGPVGSEGAPGRDGRDGLSGVPGQSGEKGLDGKDGRDGVDGLHGKDGFGFDDFEEVFDGERTYTRRYKQGDRVKEFTSKVAYVLDRGVYKPDTVYEKGDGVTWGGSFWIAQQDTQAKPGDPGIESRAWRLAVKAGRDGKGEKGERGTDGKPGKDGKYS